MIGDKLTYHPAYRAITQFVISQLEDQLSEGRRLCIAVGGESGCGKTSLAYALQKDIEDRKGMKGFLFHLDDYFILPPSDNHNERLADISLVGPKEVNLALLDSNLDQFKSGPKVISKPLVDYHANSILEEYITAGDYHFCIVEGTYVCELKSPDYKIFIETTYLDTRKQRVARGRDQISEFNERVLEIEHQIIKSHHELADLVIDKELNTKTNS